MNRIALLTFLIATTIFGSITLIEYKVEDDTHNYTVDVKIDDSKYVTDFLGIGVYTYYEDLTFTTTTAGNYGFTNNTATLTNGVQDTAILLYNNQEANLIIDEPWAFYSSDQFYFGGGQDNVRNLQNESDALFDTILSLDADTQYTAVFTSFTGNVLGDMQIELNAPSQIQSNQINVPEPKDTGLIFAVFIGIFVIYCYYKSR